MKRLLYLLPFLFLMQCTLPDIADVIPPITVVVYPYEGAVVTKNIQVTIQASDDTELAKVWYYVDGVKMEEKTAPPFSFTLNVTGLTKKVNHVIQSAAQDKDGNIGYSPVVNFIVADSPDITPPTVMITNPQPGQVVVGMVNIIAYAEDERSIQKVAFFIDGDSMGVTSAYPYMYNWNTEGYSDSTAHTIFAKAFDSGNNSTISPVVTVTVYPRTGPAGDATAPSALFLYPITGTTVQGTIQVSVDLSDNQGVSKAEFYVDGQLTESADNPPSPWIFDWDTSAKADSSSHSLYVKAFDEAGNVGTTGLLIVTVQ